MPRLSVDISLEQHRALKWAAMQAPGATVTTVVRGWLDRLPVPPQGDRIAGLDEIPPDDPEPESRSTEPVIIGGVPAVPVATHDWHEVADAMEAEADIYDVLGGAEPLDGRDFVGPNPIPQGAVSGCAHLSKRILPYGTFCETCGTKL